MMQEGHQCTICFEDACHNPITLHCQHVYCAKCILMWWEGKFQYTCPQCRGVVWHRPKVTGTWMSLPYIFLIFTFILGICVWLLGLYGICYTYLPYNRIFEPHVTHKYPFGPPGLLGK